MNVILLIALIIVLIAVLAFVYIDSKRSKGRIEPVLVAYSEKVGNSLVEHDKQYAGSLNFKDDMFKIKDLDITLPIPDSKTLCPTNSGKKKIYLIKLDSERWGFRIPSLSNTIYVQERDTQGNPIKVNGMPKLIKFKWNFCDDIVEPDVKHWDENVMEKLRQKHRTTMDNLSKWILPIGVALILIAGIVTIQMVTKYAGEQLKEMRTISSETAEKVEQNAGLINGLINRINPNNQNNEPKEGEK